MAHRLDQWDRQIISILQRNGRTSNVDIARQLGLAEATVRKRIDRLLRSEAISVVAIADPEKLGLATRMILAVQTDQTQLEAAARRLATFPEVCTVSIVTGTYDIIVEVALPSSGHLLAFVLDKVVATPGVKRTDTYHVLKVVKRSCEWTVPDEPIGEIKPSDQRSREASENVVPGAIVIPS